MNGNIYSMRLRFAVDIALFFSVLYAPWWFVSAIVFLSIFRFKNFYEAFLGGLAFDILYGTNISSLHGFHFVFSSAFLFLIVVADFVKTKVRV